MIPLEQLFTMFESGVAVMRSTINGDFEQKTTILVEQTDENEPETHICKFLFWIL